MVFNRCTTVSTVIMTVLCYSNYVSAQAGSLSGVLLAGMRIHAEWLLQNDYVYA